MSNEGDAQAGLEILYKLKADLQSSTADVIKGVAAMQREIDNLGGIKVKLDPSAVRGGVEQAKHTEDMSRASANATRELKTFTEIIKGFGQGTPPRRTFSTMATQGLMGIGMGENAASLLGGISGNAFGSMAFRLLWDVMGVVEKLPEKIGEYIQGNQAIDVARARMAGTTASELAAPNKAETMTADKEALAAISAGSYLMHRLDENGKGGDEFKSTLNTLVTQWAGTENDPTKRSKLIGDLTMAARDAQLAHIGAGMGDSLQVANAAVALQRTGDAAAATTLMNQPGMMQFMVGKFREKYPGLGALSDSQLWPRVQAGIAAELTTPAFRQQGIGSVLSAYQNVLGSNQNVAAMRTKMEQLQIGKDLAQDWDSLFGTKEKLSSADIHALNMFGKMRSYYGITSEQAMERYRDWYKPQEGGRIGFASPERLKTLSAPMDSVLGMLSGQGTVPDYKSPMMGQPSFSFSSLSEFANKMQKEGGFSLDDSAMTAKNTERTVTVLERIETHLAGGPIQGFGATLDKAIGHWMGHGTS